MVTAIDPACQSMLIHATGDMLVTMEKLLDDQPNPPLAFGMVTCAIHTKKGDNEAMAVRAHGITSNNTAELTIVLCQMSRWIDEKLHMLSHEDPRVAPLAAYFGKGPLA